MHEHVRHEGVDRHSARDGFGSHAVSYRVSRVAQAQRWLILQASAFLRHRSRLGCFNRSIDLFGRSTKAVTISAST